MEHDEKLVHMHGRMPCAVNRKREIYDGQSGPESTTHLSPGPNKAVHQAMAQMIPKKHLQMTDNPEFDTLYLPTIDANGMKKGLN